VPEAKDPVVTFEANENEAITITSDPYEVETNEEPKEYVLDATATYIDSDPYVAEEKSVAAFVEESHEDTAVSITSDPYVPPVEEEVAAEETQANNGAVFIESDAYSPPEAVVVEASPDDGRDTAIFIESEDFTPPEEATEATVEEEEEEKGEADPVTYIDTEPVVEAEKKERRKAVEEDDQEESSALDWIVPLGLAVGVVAAGFFLYQMTQAPTDSKKD